jgi:RHS repeat-associated protein
LYSDEGLVGEYDASGNPIRSYGYKPNGLWGTNPQFLKVGTNYYFYHNDQLGTPQKLTGETGAVVWSADYTSFGKASVDAGSTITNNLRFAGQYYDDESGLHYNWHRYYDPTTGRYLRTDPLGFMGGDANLYAYVWNDPVNWSDPSGLIPLDTLLDIIYIGIDIYNIATDICSRGEHVRSLGLDLLGMMLPYATGLGKAYRATKIHAPCFVEGTPVETESGLKPIEEVKVGDLILSRDEKTGERSFKKALATYETPDQWIIEIQLDSEDGGTETIGATAEHPFWVKARGWVGAGDLLPGDEVFTSQGGWIKVSGSTWLSKRQTVYNLEVEDYHTYFVGESGAWVHNMCAMPPRKTFKKRYIELVDDARDIYDANVTVQRNGKDLFRVHQPSSGHGTNVTQIVRRPRPSDGLVFETPREVPVRRTHVKQLEKALDPGNSKYTVRTRRGRR